MRAGCYARTVGLRKLVQAVGFYVFVIAEFNNWTPNRIKLMGRSSVKKLLNMFFRSLFLRFRIRSPAVDYDGHAR
jgi:hypothetical protein